MSSRQSLNRPEQSGRSNNDPGEGSSAGNSRDSLADASSDHWPALYLQHTITRSFPDFFYRVDLSKMWLETCTRLQGVSLIRSQNRSMTSAIEDCSRNFITRFHSLCQRYFRLFANRERCPVGLPLVSVKILFKNIKNIKQVFY